MAHATSQLHNDQRSSGIGPLIKDPLQALWGHWPTNMHEPETLEEAVEGNLPSDTDENKPSISDNNQEDKVEGLSSQFNTSTDSTNQVLVK